MTLAKQLLGVTKAITEEEEGLVSAPGNDPDIKTKKLSGEDADQNNVTDGKGEDSPDHMEYSDEVVDEPDEGPEFNDAVEFNGGSEFDDEKKKEE